MNRSVLGLVAVIVLGGGMAVVTADVWSGKSIPDTELGLSKSSVFEVPTPEPVIDNPAEPGESTPAPRANPETPPVIPHAIGDFLPITRDENACLECHLVQEKIEGEPTPVPESHFIDLRSARGESSGRAGESVVGARYVCVSCHVRQTEATPLVGNPRAGG